MDWKRFYRDEVSRPEGVEAIRTALARHAAGDPAVVGTLRGRGIVSFPHTTLCDSAEPIARVVTSILACRTPRVVALGVLHGGTLPEPHRGDVAEFHRGSPRADEIFARLGGAFPEGHALAVNEFSLDLFTAVLDEAARQHAVAPPEVTRTFVSLTRDAAGSFAIAERVADEVRRAWTRDAVCVATGDLVHFGHSYTPEQEMAGLPDDEAGLAAHLRPRIDAMHAAALEGHDFATAYAIGSEIRSDQRNLLPVVAHLLGPGARADVLSFRLSDYSAINAVPVPCFVASALVAFRPGASSSARLT